MKAILYNSAGALRLIDDVEIPSISSEQILVKVVACGVNRLDLLQKAGRYPPPQGESTILGVEVSGYVHDIGDKAAAASGLKVGDGVCALVGGGGYAGYCVVPWETTVLIPNGISVLDAAGIPEAYLTAYSALMWSARMRQGESVMIHAGASGVGTAAALIAKATGSSQIFVTSGSDAKLEACSKLVNGDIHCINYKVKNFADEVLKATNGRGVDIIVDFVGASYWEKNLRSIALDGRIVLLGLEVQSQNVGLIWEQS
ncbi:quinone oxidoreductase PIG3-like isoform X2 [Corticium candelabrum]|uniref:quinone oxidoreductase PIG3-like isoform X2 n=1 Tax=Corticium candelabrum TaxID=121492 RepID=UPI002E269DF8|nr:quinone oxidoreductase PIG3-like isoform X2 [Corticium candelabrum]